MVDVQSIHGMASQKKYVCVVVCVCVRDVCVCVHVFTHRDMF